MHLGSDLYEKCRLLNCSYGCKNGSDGYVCFCPSGYNLTDDARTCQGKQHGVVLSDEVNNFLYEWSMSRRLLHHQVVCTWHHDDFFNIGRDGKSHRSDISDVNL